MKTLLILSFAFAAQIASAGPQQNCESEMGMNWSCSYRWSTKSGTYATDRCGGRANFACYEEIHYECTDGSRTKNCEARVFDGRCKTAFQKCY